MPQSSAKPQRRYARKAASAHASTPAEITADTPAIVTNPPKSQPQPQPKGKIGVVVEMLRRVDGTTIEAMMAATGWQAHSVRGALSGSVKKALGLTVVSEKTNAGRIYRIVEGAGA